MAECVCSDGFTAPREPAAAEGSAGRPWGEPLLEQVEVRKEDFADEGPAYGSGKIAGFASWSGKSCVPQLDPVPIEFRQ